MLSTHARLGSGRPALAAVPALDASQDARQRKRGFRRDARATTGLRVRVARPGLLLLHDAHTQRARLRSWAGVLLRPAKPPEPRMRAKLRHYAGGVAEESLAPASRCSHGGALMGAKQVKPRCPGRLPSSRARSRRLARSAGRARAGGRCSWANRSPRRASSTALSSRSAPPRPRGRRGPRGSGALPAAAELRDDDLRGLAMLARRARLLQRDPLAKAWPPFRRRDRHIRSVARLEVLRPPLPRATRWRFRGSARISTHPDTECL